MLLGSPLTDYSQHARIVKAFEPYANLWTVAANWVRWQSEWLKGPFCHLDPEEMEKELGNAQRTMFKLVKQVPQPLQRWNPTKATAAPPTPPPAPSHAHASVT